MSKNRSKSKIKFSWKKKTAIYIGRFQPFHDGHKKLFLKALKRDNQIAIMVMDSFGYNKKNPFKFEYVKKKINHELINYKNRYKIFKIPMVSRVIYGRKVGYKIERVKLDKKTENISATKIRRKIKKISF